MAHVNLAFISKRNLIRKGGEKADEECINADNTPQETGALSVWFKWWAEKS